MDSVNDTEIYADDLGTNKHQNKAKISRAAIKREIMQNIYCCITLNSSHPDSTYQSLPSNEEGKHAKHT